MFYFDEFFYDFKKDIYKNRNRKMHIIDAILLSITIIFALTALIMFELKGLKIIIINNKALYVILLTVFSLVSIIIYIFLFYKISRENKNIDFSKFHKENVTDKIIDLLSQEKFKFYNLNSIDWLINCCNKKLIKQSPYNEIISYLKYFVGLFLPLLTLALGTMVSKLSEEGLIYYIAILIIGFGFFVGVSIMVTPIIKFLAFPNKNCLEYLLDELEFIKVNLLKNKIEP